MLGVLGVLGVLGALGRVGVNMKYRAHFPYVLLLACHPSPSPSSSRSWPTRRFHTTASVPLASSE